MSNFVKHYCVKCGKLRKFLVGTPRAARKICGECWKWEDDQ